MTARLRRMALLVTGACLALVVLALPAPAMAVNEQDITDFQVEPLDPAPGSKVPFLDAGAHPKARIFMRFCSQPPDTPGMVLGCTPEETNTQLKDFEIKLPPGFLGNPTSANVCPTHLWVASACPADSVLGFSLTRTVTRGGVNIQVAVQTLIYNVETLGLEPARLGTRLLGSTPPVPVPIVIRIRTEDDYGIDSAITNLPRALGGPDANVESIDTVLCSHVPCEIDQSLQSDPTNVEPVPGAKPFFTNPTSCKPAVATLRASSYQQPGVTREATDSFTPENCDAVPFGPAVTVTPLTDEGKSAAEDPNATIAGSRRSQEVAIQYPRTEPANCTTDNDPATCTYENNEKWEAQLRNAFVTLPAGVSLSPAGGVGLEACTAAQFGVDLSTSPPKANNNPAACPEGAHIGDIKVDSPAVPDPILGKVYFGPTSGPGRPTPARPWKLFLLLEGAGLRIKLVGDVSLCTGPGAPTSDCTRDGQISTVFLNQPEVPFSRFELKLRGGPNAPLMNPPECGEHKGDVALRGWNDKSSFSEPAVTTTGCIDAFQPIVRDASAHPTQAGAFSVSHLRFDVPDRHQLLKGLTLKLPPGAVGSLAAVPLCPAGTVAALAANPSVNCPVESKVGTIRTTLGSENGLITVSGEIFIGESVNQGDAASFVIVIPAKVGPIDLGRVALVNRAIVDPNDATIDVISPPIPTILEGIPLPVRSIDITVDRERFFLNPTSCAPATFVADFTSEKGRTASSSFTTAATGCDALPFAPKLRLIAGDQGLTDTNDHPPLKAIVTQEYGESNISRARVVVPDLLRPNVPQFQKPGALCNDQQLASRSCPALSQVGTANVTTPVLPFKLEGPVYIVLESGKPLPKLVVFLRGGNGIEVILNASNGFEGIKILNTFDNVPDVAQSRFELNIKGGPNGILNAFRDLCDEEPLPEIDAQFTGHNGKTYKDRPRLETDGCVSASSLVSIASSRVRLTRRGVAKIRVRCPAGKLCDGRLTLRSAGRVKVKKRGKRRLLSAGRKSFSIRPGRTGTVRVKLPKTARRVVFSRKRLRTRTTATIDGARRAKTLVLLAPARKRR